MSLLSADSEPVVRLFEPPWSWDVTKIAEGTCEFGVVARDGRNMGLSQPVTIVVGNPDGLDTTGGADTTTGVAPEGTDGGDTSTGGPSETSLDDDGCGCAHERRPSHAAWLVAVVLWRTRTTILRGSAYPRRTVHHPRVAILGNSGSGKSTLAKAIAAELDCESLDLDTIAWEPGKIAVARAQADAEAELTAFCEGRPRWVIEGCYGDLIAAALVWRPELVLLDPGVAACVRNCIARPWEPHKYASKAEQDQRLEFLLEWVRGYDARDGPMSGAFHRAVFERYDGPKRRVG